MKKLRGFTLVELMIVIAIIGILTAIAITIYKDSVAKAQLTEAITIADGMKTAVASYQHETGSCPMSGTGGILSPTSYAGHYVASASVSASSGNCVITALMRSNSVSARIQGKTVSLTMVPGGGTAQWQCSSTAPSKYLPKTCR